MNIKTLFLLIFFGFIFISCSSEKPKDEVVIYTSVDQVFSAKILKQFEKETGIRVKAVYDTEATKAVGLEKRLYQERQHPKADIFWNSENLRTARLDAQGIFVPQPNKVKLYEDTDTKYISENKTWFGMGIRSRVFIVNSDLLTKELYPSKLEDIIDPQYKGKVAISSPLFGTASAQFASLYAKWGTERFINFLKNIKKNDVAILAGNSTVKNAVGRGEYVFGLVDTDDALVGIAQGLPIEMIYYDQEEDGMFEVYQSIGIIKNGPNPKVAQKLFDYLLSAELEDKLIKMNAVQFPILSKNLFHKKPVLWSLATEKISTYLKPSSELVRKYLD